MECLEWQLHVSFDVWLWWRYSHPEQNLDNKRSSDRTEVRELSYHGNATKKVSSDTSLQSGL